MKNRRINYVKVVVVSAALAFLWNCGVALAQTIAAARVSTTPAWTIVVNSSYIVPGDTRAFNSFNQPSINVSKLVAFRGRSKSGSTANGEPAHGVFYRRMDDKKSQILMLFDRNTPVPQPNNLTVQNGTGAITFIEPPAFPRVDMWSDTIASRGNHPPVWEYVTGTDPLTNLPLTSRAGTTGIYTNPLFGKSRNLITGASNLGVVPDFTFFSVPPGSDSLLTTDPVKFDVFPGAPAVTNGNVIVFKGNYTLPAPTADDPTATMGRTGVYYRNLRSAPIPIDGGAAQLQPAGGVSSAILIANSDTAIPGSGAKFGSAAPPSAVGNVVVFAGFDNEDAPTLGGIYSAVLDGTPKPPLTSLVQIGSPVPGESNGETFDRIGEGLSFDGRFVGFWGAWLSDSAYSEIVLQCPTDGNRSVIAYCQGLYGDGVDGGTAGNGFLVRVPVHQGIFVHDTETHITYAIAKTSPSSFTDFVYWNFSGKVPPPKGGSDDQGGTGGAGETQVIANAGGDSGGDAGGDTDGEPARWRSAAFVAVSGMVGGKLSPKNLYAAFKARTGQISQNQYVDFTDGIYFRGNSDPAAQFTTFVATGMDGTLFDPGATYVPTDESGNVIGPEAPLPVTSMGIERDGFRGDNVVINIGMANEFANWAGIYLTNVKK